MAVRLEGRAAIREYSRQILASSLRLDEYEVAELYQTQDPEHARRGGSTRPIPDPADIITDGDVRTADVACDIRLICTLVRVWRFRTPTLPNGTICACRVSAWRVAGDVGGSAE